MSGFQLPPRAFYKRQARQTIVHSIRSVMAVSGIVLAFQLAALLFQLNFGGVINFLMFKASDYTSSTGIWLANNGFTAILRLDAAGVLLALPMSNREVIVFVLSNVLIFLILTPLLMGALEQFQAILLNKFQGVSDIFRWYTDLRLTAKALGLGLVLALVKWVTRAVCVGPGIALFAWVAGSGKPEILLYLSYAVILAGTAVSYWIYALFLPARYLLVRKPETPVGKAIANGMQAMRNRRGDYFLFRLSFILWNLAVNFSYGIMGGFVLPYTELSNLLYLRDAAPVREAETPAEI